MTQIIGLGGQKNVNFTNWDINQQYRPGDMVVYNSIIYTTTTNIPAGTPFGAEWTVAVSGGAATYAAEANVAFNLDAADPANLTIAGGNVGDVLTTDGLGNVTWEAPGGAAALPIANGTSQFDIPVADSTVEITSNGSHTWSFGDTGTLSVPGAIIPDANIAYDLGNATNRFRDIYLSNNTIYMGDQSISANAGIITFSGNIDASGMVASGNVTIAGDLTVTGNTTQINVTDLMVQDPIIAMGGGANGANATTYDAKDRGLLLQDYYPDGSGVNNHFFGWKSSAAQFEAIANVTDSSTGVITGTLGNVAAAGFTGDLTGSVLTPSQTNITTVGTLTDLTVDNHILPNANITYDLGSPTQRWKDLYLSNNTIYMGDQTISANATHMNLTGTVNATVFEGVLSNGTSTIAMSTVDGNIDFVVGGAQQWAMGTDGALVAANTTASIAGTSDQTLSIRSGSLVIGTADNLVPDGTVNDFTFVGGNGGAGDAAGHGGNLVMSTGIGGLGLNGNDGAPGGAFMVLTGLGGQCDAGATPGPSGEIRLETAAALEAVGAPGPSSGSITIATGIGGTGDTGDSGRSGGIELTTGKGGNGTATSWAGEAGAIILTAGDGGDIPDNSRGAEQGGPIEIRSGNGGNGRNGGRGGDIDVIAGDGGTGTTSNGGRGGEIVLRSGDGSSTSGDQPGDGGAIELRSGNGGEGITDFGGNADGVEIRTGNGGDGVDASAVNHGGGSPWGDAGPLRLRTGTGGTVQQGEAGYGGNIEIETGPGGNTGSSGPGAGGDAGNMSVILGNGGRSNDGRGGPGGSFTFTAGVGGQGTSGGNGGSLTLTAGAGGSGGSTMGDGGDITLVTAGGQAKLDAASNFTVTSNVNAKNFNANVNGALTFPVNATRISENVLGAEVTTADLPAQTVTGTGTGGTIRVKYSPGSASYTRADGRGTGTGYVVGDQVLILGSLLGGTDGVNDLTVEVVYVGGSGEIDYGPLTIVSGTPIAGPAGMNIETDGDNWSFSNRTFTVPGDIQSDGRDDFNIICNDPEDDGLVMTLKYNLEGTVTSMVELEDGQINLEVEDQVDIRVRNNITSGYHRWSFGSSGAKGVLSLVDDTSEIETNDNDLNLIACKSSTFADGNDVSLISRWNTNNVEWTKATVGYENITLTTNMGRSATEYQWTFTQTGILQLPEYNNELSSLIGTRNTIATTASPITAPTGTPTSIYTPTTDVYSYKAIVTIKHNTGGSIDIETFEVMASTGATSTVFTVSNRLNTLGSNGGLNDTVVTIGAGFDLIIDAKYGDTNTVTFAVTEFK